VDVKKILRRGAIIIYYYYSEYIYFGRLCHRQELIRRNLNILSITPIFYFVISPSVSLIVIVIMYHLVPTLESFEIIEGTEFSLNLS
jgi:hypothetical protein